MESDLMESDLTGSDLMESNLMGGDLMKRIIALVLCACVAALAVSACGNGGSGGLGEVTVYRNNGAGTAGDGGGDRGDGSGGERDGGNGGEGGGFFFGGDSDPTSGDSASDDPDPVGDPVSTKALAGYWTYMGSNQATSWVFGEDGRFAGLLVAQSGSSYLDSYGYSYYRASSAYKHLLQGDYRVSGGVIKFTNCQISTAMTFDGEYWHDSGINDAADKLLFAPLDEPKRADDFTMEFEFIDQLRLRIRLDRGALEEYDWDFTREDGPVTVPIPTHRIPPMAWPDAMLSPEMPEYGEPGRVRRVYNSEYDSNEPAYKNWYINIDRTSFDKVLSYAQALRSAGWTGPMDEEIRNEKEKASTGILSVISKTFDFTFQKGCYKVITWVYSEDNIQICAWREIEGFWPSDLFGDEFAPPPGAVIIGETVMEDLLSYNGVDYYFSMNIDFYPGTASGYINSLMANGFSDTYMGYGEIYNWIRIGGRMYKVRVDPGYSNNDTIVSIRYMIGYYPDFAWPTDIPPGIVPPAGVALYCDYESEPRPIMNDRGDYGSFQFFAVNLSDAGAEAYKDALTASGWESSWASGGDQTKDITWNGHNWYCTFSGGDYTYEGSTQFSFSFMLYDG